MNTQSVICRIYRPSDYPEVEDLFRRGIATGAGSAGQIALRHKISMAWKLALPLVAFGIFITAFFRSHRVVQLVGILLAMVSLCVPILLRIMLPIAFESYVQKSLDMDLHDIPHFYALTQPQANESEGLSTANNLEALTPSGFWVAVVNSGSINEKVVGCIALDCPRDAAAKHQTAVLRRMSVDERCRKLGIGRKLLETLFAHARSFPKTQINTIALGVSEFQPAAIAFYERAGFEKQGVTIYGPSDLLSRTVGASVRLFTYRRSLYDDIKVLPHRGVDSESPIV